MGNAAGSRRPSSRRVPQDPLLEPLQPLFCCQKRDYWVGALAMLPSSDGAAPRIVRGPYEADHPIEVWDSDTGEITHSVHDHDGDVRVLVAFELEPGHGQLRLASAHGGAEGGMLVLWAVDEDFRRVTAVVAHRGGVTSLVLLDKGDPEGEGRPRLVSGGADATVKV
jgi:WD40 repeat protein